MTVHFPDLWGLVLDVDPEVDSGKATVASNRRGPFEMTWHRLPSMDNKCRYALVWGDRRWISDAVPTSIGGAVTDFDMGYYPCKVAYD